MRDVEIRYHKTSAMLKVALRLLLHKLTAALNSLGRLQLNSAIHQGPVVRSPFSLIGG